MCKNRIKPDAVIEPTPYGSNEYEGLRTLWCEVFGDGPGFVDAVYSCFGEDISGWVVKDPEGRVCSALTCYRCGSFEDRPVYVSYAICTRADSRGHGYAGMLTEYMRDRIISCGGISLVSPAEESLEKYYASHGYRPFCFAYTGAVLSPDLENDGLDGFDELEEFEGFELDFGNDAVDPPAPAMEMKVVNSEVYGRYREAFLNEYPHIELSEAMLRLAKAESLDWNGLLFINRGDAICAVSRADASQVILTELIVNPILLEISSEIENEIAGMIAKHFDAAETLYSAPGRGRCQSMAAGMDRNNCAAYFGFPID